MDTTKNKSISWVACPYDYRPDYEETYKGYVFTVGIEIYGNYSATIEFDTIKSMCACLGVDEADIKDKNPRVLKFPLIEEVFHTSEIDVFGKNSLDGNKACMWIRTVGHNMNPSNKEVSIITLKRLEIALNKYKTSFEKFPDTVEAYNNQKNLVKRNPLFDKLESLSDEACIDATEDINKSFMIEKYNMRVNYLTEKIVIDMCHRFIDRISSEMSVYDKHKDFIKSLKPNTKKPYAISRSTSKKKER